MESLWKRCICLRGRGAVGLSIQYCDFLDSLRHCQILKNGSTAWIELVLRSERDRAVSSIVLKLMLSVSVQQNCLIDCSLSLYHCQHFSCLVLTKARIGLRILLAGTVICVLCAVVRTDRTSALYML
jgi:hypothetical protein